MFERDVIMKKACKFLLFLLPLMLCFCFGAGAASSGGTCGTAVTWRFDDTDGCMYISGSGKMTNYNSKLLAPWASLRPYIRTVTIENGVESIGSNAFLSCNNLTNVTLPASVVSIGMAAFKSCTALPDISIEAGTQQIGDEAFYGCAMLQNITLPSRMTYIGKSTFYDCTQLTSIQIPDGIQSIVEKTFMNCYKLQSVMLPSSVSSIGAWAFNSCTSLSEIDIPQKVTFIDSFAFKGCSNLANVTIPAGVTDISGFVFSDCVGLESITILNRYCNIGSIPQTATICGYSGSTAQTYAYQNNHKFVAIDVHQHNYSAEWTIDIAPTCTESGEKSLHCLTCESRTSVTAIPATGHRFGDWMIVEEAGIDRPGKVLRTCKVCYAEETATTSCRSRGDADGDGIITVKDVLLTLHTLMCAEESNDYMDMDGNGVLTLSDVIMILKAIS